MTGFRAGGLQSLRYHGTVGFVDRCRVEIFVERPEPFGMVMIEAMACGTPVLATARGSVPEVVADGVTGFVRATPDELVEAVARIGEIDRRACRRRVAEMFSAEVMTAGYERLARAELAGRRRLPIAIEPLGGSSTARSSSHPPWSRAPVCEAPSPARGNARGEGRPWLARSR